MGRLKRRPINRGITIVHRRVLVVIDLLTGTVRILEARRGNVV